MELPQKGELLTVAQVAKHYGVCDETIRRWMRKGAISYVHVGPSRLKKILREEAERHLATPKSSV